MHPENHYLDILRQLLASKEERVDRTGVGTYSFFGSRLDFSLEDGSFPLLTTKQLHFKSIVYELCWFLQGGRNINYLQKQGISIWDEWADENGDLGPIYGAQWRAWKDKQGGEIDQIANIIDALVKEPYGRRHLLSSWNVAELPQMKLAPCHVLAQFYVTNQGALSCQFYQRSVDVFLGLPFNIASYALLTCLLAHVCHLKPGKLIFIGGDTHLYRNHIAQASEQIQRTPYTFPKLKLDPSLLQEERRHLKNLDYTDIKLLGYQYHPKIQAPIAV